jgi:hypothetical protein
MPNLLPSVEIDKLPQGNPKVGDFFVFKDMQDSVTKKVPAAALLTSSNDQNFAWVSNANSGVGYATNESVTYGGYWFTSLVDANLTTPGVDPTKWQQVSKVFGTVRVWQAGLYANAEEYVVGYNPQGFLFMWRLATGITRPFISTDFNTEINNGTWEPFDKAYIDTVRTRTTTVSTSVNPIVFDMTSNDRVVFTGLSNIVSNKTWQLSNIGKEVIIRFHISAGSVQTMPATFKMNDANWDSVGKTWTPPDTGDYEAIATYNGTDWYLKIIGPYN